MIRFDLQCPEGHVFEGWFRGGEAYDEQARSGSLTCPVCGHSEIRKAMMAPAVARGRGDVPAEDPRRVALGQMMQAMREVQRHVETHFDNVGERFPEEARKIHSGDAPHRDIYGKASSEEAAALRDEGVPIRQLPVLPKLDG
jgi:hypothetical protein